MKLQIGVIGPAKEEYPDNEIECARIEKTAERLGELIAEKGHIIITGGCDGVMEAASRGAKKRGGVVVGTPGRTRGSSNKFVDVEICTPIDIGDFLFAGTWSCDVILVIPSSAGTMAEFCLAYRAKRPIIVIEGFDKIYDDMINNYIDNGKFVKIYGAKNAEEAIELIDFLTDSRM